MANDGKELEYLIHLIEGSIDSESTLEHDVQMPVIGSSSGRTRQCDLVIRTRKPPRETISIVEVQDRSRSVDQTMFDGWIAKMEEVGAQHLICVSRHDYPVSIKEKALQRGNTVRLITLQELDVGSIPLDFFNLMLAYRKFDLTEINEPQVVSSRSEVEALGIRDAVVERMKLPVGANECCWSLDKEELLSLFILCRDFFVVPDGMSEGEGEISFSFDEVPALFMHVEGLFFRVGLECKFHWTNEEIRKPASILSYEQDNKAHISP